MKLFTVGPVEMHPGTLAVAGRQLPYFRTDEFSRTVNECDAMMRTLTGAPAGSRTVLLTASGTGAMEMAVTSCIPRSGKALVIDGGSFGARFCEICETVGIAYDRIRLEPGKSLDPAVLDGRDLSGYRALLLNAHETSTGVLYDLPAIGRRCRESGMLFIVDAISAFLCDEIDMAAMNIDLLITSSQKALALEPGLSLLVYAPAALEAAAEVPAVSCYFNLSSYLSNAERGQTPFTPAVGIVLQLHERLKTLVAAGLAAQVKRTAGLAQHFRRQLAGLPFRIFSDHPSNALTALAPTDGTSAHDVYLRLKEEGLVVTPNGGALADRVFRVGHMGNITEHDLDELIRAMKGLS